MFWKVEKSEIRGLVTKFILLGGKLKTVFTVFEKMRGSRTSSVVFNTTFEFKIIFLCRVFFLSSKLWCLILPMGWRRP